MVRPRELFYIIPRHNRANPNVRLHMPKQGGGECVFSRFRFSRDFPAYRFNGEEKKRKKRLPLVSGSRSWPSQPCRAIIIMNSEGATLHPDSQGNRHRVLLCKLRACTKKATPREIIQKAVDRYGRLVSGPVKFGGLVRRSASDHESIEICGTKFSFQPHDTQ